MILAKYRDLLALTQLYILQEYALTDRVFEDQETFDYFRKQAQQQKNAVPTPPQQALPTAASPPTPQRTITAPNKSHPASMTAATAPLPTKIPPLAPVKLEAKPSTAPVPAKTLETPPASSISTLPEPKKTAEKTPTTKTTFAIAPPSPVKEIELNDLRKIISEKLPQFQLLNHIPDDSAARRLATPGEKNSPQVAILTFNEIPAHQTFLLNIAKTLEIYGVTAQLYSAAKIEQEKGWDAFLKSEQLRLVIANGGLPYSLPEMQKHHREIQKMARHYLGNHPLLPLSDISFYLIEPPLKQSLWNAIREILELSFKGK